MQFGYVRRLIFFIIAFLLFIVSPLYYSDLLIIMNCIVYLAITYDCWKLDRYDGMLISFNFFFLSILFICTYIYPLFVLKSDEIFLVLFSDGFVERYMVKATSLVNLAVASLALGEHFGRKKKVSDSTYNTSFTQVQIIGKLEYISFILYTIPLYLFILNKQENSDLTNYYLVDLSHAILYLSMIIKLSYYRKVCNNRKFLSFVMDNKKLFFIYSFIILTSLYIGDRTLPIFLSLFLLMIYNYYFKKVKLAYLLPLSLIAMFFLFTVGQSRGSDKYSIRVGGMDSYVRYVESTLAEIDNFALIMSDYMPSSIVLTRSFEYLDKNNEIVHNPTRAIIILLSPIPMLPSIASDLLFDKPVKELSSAYTITSDYVKTVRKTDSGMGTHVVADIYFSWGVIGVIVFFFLFGKLVARSQKNSLNSVKYAIVFFTVVSFSIYMPRDTLYSCFRLVCYQLFILWILSSFNKRQCI